MFTKCLVMFSNYWTKYFQVKNVGIFRYLNLICQSFFLNLYLWFKMLYNNTNNANNNPNNNANKLPLLTN